MAKQWTQEELDTSAIAVFRMRNAKTGARKPHVSTLMTVYRDIAIDLQCELTEAAELLEHAGIPPIFSTIKPAARWNEKRNAWLSRNRKEDA